MAIHSDRPTDLPKVPEGVSTGATGTGTEKKTPDQAVERVADAATKGGLRTSGSTTVHQPPKPIIPVFSPPPSPPPSPPSSPRVSRREPVPPPEPQKTYATPEVKEKKVEALRKAADVRVANQQDISTILKTHQGYTKINDIVNYENFVLPIDPETVKSILSAQKPNIGIVYSNNQETDETKKLCLMYKDENGTPQIKHFGTKDSVEDICNTHGVTLMKVSPEIKENPHFQGFSRLNLLRLEAIKIDVSREQPPTTADYYTRAMTMLGLVQKEEFGITGAMPVEKSEGTKYLVAEGKSDKDGLLLYSRDIYSDIQPYTHNMVPCAQTGNNLDGYLNASFVVAEGRLFLACQGPLKKALVDTIPDLYSALISNNTKLILSLGAVVEAGKVKFSSAFFLDGENETLSVETSYGKCTVKQKGKQEREEVVPYSDPTKEPLKAKFIIREYELTFADGTVKSMKNCHCENWPDRQSVPAKVVADLIGLINTECKEPKDAVAVHCSAGVGRTGTIISAYSIDQKIKAGEETIPLGAIVTETRAQRYGCVQTSSQLSLLAEYAQLAKKMRE